MHPWICCVRLNDHDKAYFLRQVEGFDHLNPLMITWQDFRDKKDPSLAVYVPQTAFEWALPRVPGAHKLRQIARRLRSAVQGHAFEASRAEIKEFRTLERPDVIYAHTGLVGLRMRSVARALGVPLAVHFHGLDVVSADPIYQAEIARALPDFAAVIVVGDWMRDWMLARGVSADRLHVVPMGADFDHVQKFADPRFTPNAPYRFITVARLVAWKGLNRVIEALAQLRDQGIEAELQIVGDGPERSRLEALCVELDLTERVHFAGLKSSDEALSMVAQADAMAHHPLDTFGGPEAFGVVIAEAMALGKPVVGTLCGGLPDQIIDGETGFLSAQNDVTAMAANMARLIADSELSQRMGSKGAERAKSALDNADLAKQAEAILDALTKAS